MLGEGRWNRVVRAGMWGQERDCGASRRADARANRMCVREKDAASVVVCESA